MKLSLPLPNSMHVAGITQPWEHRLGGGELVTIAQTADELGFEAIQVPEHLAMPSVHVELSGDHWLDVATSQGFLAGATKRIRLSSMLSILPLRHPILTAKALATLDWLSGGRAMLTIGVGWLEDEFVLMDVPFRERGRRGDEYLAAMFELWHSDQPSFDGRYISFHDITFAPKPVQQPHPPLWVGGDSDAALRRAARFGDGWAPFRTPPDQLHERLDQLRSLPEWDARDSADRRPFDVYFSLAALNIGDAHVILDDPRSQGSRNAQHVIEQCGWLAEQGVTQTWVNPPPVSGLDEYLDHLRWVAEEVMTAVR
jgi:probable F420-dependent oxidoreductase